MHQLVVARAMESGQSRAITSGIHTVLRTRDEDDVNLVQLVKPRKVQTDEAKLRVDPEDSPAFPSGCRPDLAEPPMAD